MKSLLLVLSMSLSFPHPTQMNEEIPPQAVPVVPVYKEEVKDYTLSLSELAGLNCLALNIYHEARNQPYEGQMAVAMVTLNRVNNDRFPDDICSVVKQHKQFSWYWDGKSDHPKEKKEWEKSKRLAEDILLFGVVKTDVSLGATHYHADYVKPFWADKFKRLTKIGDHIFYLDK